MKPTSLAAIFSFALTASCGNPQSSDNQAGNVATDYGVAVEASDQGNDIGLDAAALENRADAVEDAFENKADAIEGNAAYDRSRPDDDVTVRNKQN